MGGENQSKVTLLMRRPGDDYAITNNPANEFEIAGRRAYDKDPEGFLRAANEEWGNLRNVFAALPNVKIVEMKPTEGLGDEVFTADPSLSLVVQTSEASSANPRHITLYSCFTNTQRGPEVEAHRQFFAAHNQKTGLQRTFYNALHPLEGTGDNVYDPARNIFWSGFSANPSRDTAHAGRSSVDAHRDLKEITGVEVVSLQVQAPFFHIDTSLGALSGGHMLVYEGGMTEESLRVLANHAFTRFGLDPSDYMIRVSRKDAEAFACNLRCIGDTVVIPECSPDLQSRIKDKGYKVQTVEMTHFIYGGGGPHCLSNNITEQCVPGGTLAARGLVVESAYAITRG